MAMEASALPLEAFPTMVAWAAHLDSLLHHDQATVSLAIK